MWTENGRPGRRLRHKSWTITIKSARHIEVDMNPVWLGLTHFKDNMHVHIYIIYI